MRRFRLVAATTLSCLLILPMSIGRAEAQTTRCTQNYGGGMTCRDSYGNTSRTTPNYGGGFTTRDSYGNTSRTTPNYGGGFTIRRGW